jgi:hypothetical protein
VWWGGDWQGAYASEMSLDWAKLDQLGLALRICEVSHSASDEASSSIS